MVEASRSLPVTLGKHKMGTMSATNALAIAPIGRLKRPRFQGPGRKRLPTKKTRMKIGVVKAMKAAQAAMLKTAPMATSPIDCISGNDGV